MAPGSSPNPLAEARAQLVATIAETRADHERVVAEVEGAAGVVGAVTTADVVRAVVAVADDWWQNPLVQRAWFRRGLKELRMDAVTRSRLASRRPRIRGCG